MSDEVNTFLKRNWQVGVLILAICTGYADVSSFKTRYVLAHTEIAVRVDNLERNGATPVRERLQSTESRTAFVEERIRTLELDAKQSQLLFNEFRSKLDIMGAQVTSIAEWVKQQQQHTR